MNTIQEMQDHATAALTIYVDQVDELGQIETSGQLADAVLIRKAINKEMDIIKAGLKPHSTGKGMDSPVCEVGVGCLFGLDGRLKVSRQ